jgi:hypothetical protein
MGKASTNPKQASCPRGQQTPPLKKEGKEGGYPRRFNCDSKNIGPSIKCYGLLPHLMVEIYTFEMDAVIDGYTCGFEQYLMNPQQRMKHRGNFTQIVNQRNRLLPQLGQPQPKGRKRSYR